MTPPAKQDDWVRRLSGDGAERDRAISELRGLLVRGLSKLLSTRSGSGLQPEDVVQDALMEILDSLDSFKGRSRFTTWAMTIATRVAISELRRLHYKDVSLDSLAAGESLTFDLAVEDGQPAGEQLDRRNILQTLRELIEAELTEKQRFATEALLGGLPVEEIARRTGSNRNAVYKLIHDARMRLREGFERAGITADDVSAALA